MAYFIVRLTLASLASQILSSSTLSSRSRFAFALLINQQTHRFAPDPVKVQTRPKTSGPGYSPVNDPPTTCSKPRRNRTDGCDYEHWLILMELTTDPKPSEEEMMDSFVKTLANVVGSEEVAKKKIYSVLYSPMSTYAGFGALISRELSEKVKGLAGVRSVEPDFYLDQANKDYGGYLVVDGKVVRCGETIVSSEKRGNAKTDHGL
ncbi:multiple organellar RNA editing factor 3, mitochondrial-like [Alnus glutinosa]|uniref:multiple organellar RNA editing factor 3, mitochondrial-like n=1 Tax=Alnus glutinosa TaxID=3517 RepID=UPI002D773BBE|nr:multiple organellar RNA editing factor 3, mitochondrial-like [Alnus glutinosa]